MELEDRQTYQSGRGQGCTGILQKRGLTEALEDGKGVIFADTMRYGLISNPWRNWGPVGERVPIAKQMEFQWGYLWAEIDVLAGEVNVWLLPEMNGSTLSKVVAKMPEKWGKNVALVWDNAGAHKSAAKHLPAGMKAIFLPAYSPELNPVERFFQELRRKIANRIFSSLQELEDALAEAIDEYCHDTGKIRRLCGYSWIIQQLNPNHNEKLNC